MKKILMSLAAVAALVGCTKEAPIANTETKEALSIVASIDLSETRVSVEGEKFTDVKWEMGDEVALSSAAGASATLKATASGDTDIRFEGEGSFAADVDTYYAVYPAAEIVDGVATFDLASQLGDDAAVLAAKAEGVAKGSIPMTFKPVNALLHVKVTGIAELAKAEFMAYNGATLAQGFTYNVASDATQPYGEVVAYTITNPAAEGFFFSLPADLDMAEGYVVRLTDANGNVCSKAYNGKTFAAATTTRVEIAWSQPTVTLGAPMTSYSYYVNGNATKANECANNIIYFPTVSSYANVQNAMVVEAGFIVDGKNYSATLDKNNKSFSMGDVTVSSLGAKSVVAYIKTKDGKTYNSATQTVYITGLPVNNVSFHSVTSMPAKWNVDGAYSFSQYGWNKLTMGEANYLRLIGRSSQSKRGYLYSDDFYIPNNINANVTVDYYFYHSSAGTSAKMDIKTGTKAEGSIVVGEHNISSTTGGNQFSSYNDINKNVTFTTSAPRLLITHSISASDKDSGFIYTTGFLGISSISILYY